MFKGQEMTIQRKRNKNITPDVTIWGVERHMNSVSPLDRYVGTKTTHSLTTKT